MRQDTTRMEILGEENLRALLAPERPVVGGKSERPFQVVEVKVFMNTFEVFRSRGGIHKNVLHGVGR